MPITSRSLRAALFASACMLPVLAHAQDADDGMLTATFAPAAVAPVRNIASVPVTGTTLNREAIRRDAANTSDTGALVTTVPGVAANSGGGVSSMPSVRGLSEQRLRIVVDAMPIDAACPNDMNSPLSYTDPQTVASIAVVPGVSPVSMGGDNIAGVISVETAPPKFAIDGKLLLTGEASVFYRSNDDGVSTALTLTAAGKHVSATYSGSYTSAGNYTGGGDLGTVRSTQYAKTDHQLALAAQTAAGLFELKGGYHSAPHEGFPNQWMDMTDNQSWFVNGRYRGMFDWGKVDLTAAYRETRHKMNFLADKLPGDMPMNTNANTFTAGLKLEVPVSQATTLRAGADYHNEWLDDYWPPVAGSMMMGPGTYVNINGARRDRVGVYGEWEQHWSPAFSMLAGVRLDHVTMNTGNVQPYGTNMMQMADVMAAATFNAADHHKADDAWSGTLLASWQAAEGVVFELGYAHKARSPNIYERYSWGRGSMASRMIGWYGDGNGYVGNLNLKPERADTVSAALRVESAGGATLRLSPYYTHVNDYIDAVFVQNLTDMMGMPTGFVQLQFANQEAEFYGLDTSASVPLLKGEHGATSLTAAASWLHGENLADHQPVYHQMPFNARIGIDHVAGPFEAGGEVQFVARKDRVDPTRHEPETSGYTLVNLWFAYTLAGYKFSVSADNLFDEAYYLPLGGVSLGDYKATGVLRPVPGRGRSVNFGLSTKF